jgi:hypothetical protein
MGIIVDLSAHTISAFFRRLNITSINDLTIAFHSDPSDRAAPVGGTIDRVTGQMLASITWHDDGGRSRTILYSMVCKPAQRVF